jgi:hypothetical protein
MSNDFIPYTVEFSNSCDTIKIKSEINTYIMHLSTNYPNYKKVTPNFVKKMNLHNKNEIIEKNAPHLTKDWKRGNFIIEDNTEISRLSQYEYDKYCFISQDSNSKENAHFFKDTQDILKKLIPKTNSV